jgi:IS4 transposase
MNKFNHNDIKEMYRLKWEVETLYDRLKNLLLVENVRGRSKLIVEQNFYSQPIIYKIVMDTTHESGL